MASRNVSMNKILDTISTYRIDEIAEFKTKLDEILAVKQNEFANTYRHIFIKGSRTNGGTRGPIKAKYVGPRGETWTGRGCMPRWLAREIANGKRVEAFLVA